MPIQSKNYCLVCGSPLLRRIFNPKPQPLAALNLPQTANKAQCAVRFPLDFHMCLICGHVFNVDFDYAQIPYWEDSNRMYNSGPLWQEHIEKMIDLIGQQGLFKGQSIDIGCGDGQFFSQVLRKYPDADLLGFEPGIDATRIVDFGVVQDYFIPERDLAIYNPTLITCRHVLEHMDDPRAFLTDLAYWSHRHMVNAYYFFEVPCINKAVNEGRSSDLLYEHVSHFTCFSFELLFRLSGFQPQAVTTTYNDEVVIGLFKLGRPIDVHDKLSHAFLSSAAASLVNVRIKLDELLKTGKIALWGGTGKSAAFINLYELKSNSFPVVVDSDVNKVGRFVPGTGQLILSPDVLVQNPVDIIIITTSWRADDICLEIQKRGIVVKQIYVLKEGGLHACYDNTSSGTITAATN